MVFFFLRPQSHDFFIDSAEERVVLVTVVVVVVVPVVVPVVVAVA